MRDLVSRSGYGSRPELELRGVFQHADAKSGVLVFLDDVEQLIGLAPEVRQACLSVIRQYASLHTVPMIVSATPAGWSVLEDGDTSFARLFDVVQLQELDLRDTIESLKGARDSLEQHHRVSIEDSAVRAAAVLGEHLRGGGFELTEIELLDAAAARLSMLRLRPPSHLDALSAELSRARDEKEAAIDAQDFELAASLRDIEKKILLSLKDAHSEWKADEQNRVLTLDDEAVAAEVAELIRHGHEVPQETNEQRVQRLLDISRRDAR